MINTYDVLVMGAGPAALCIASELVQQGLIVGALASHSPEKPWQNTYGIWAEELEHLGLASLLEHRWKDTISYFGDGKNEKGKKPICHSFDYGLFDQSVFQELLLEKCKNMNWFIETAKDIEYKNEITQVICNSGNTFKARVVIDASGHRSPFIKRPDHGPVAQQAAYGVVGRFSSPPVDENQFVLMDFRPDHLSGDELKEPPTFLYAMDLGKGVYFVEETSLACAPAIPWSRLKQRLISRLSKKGIVIHEILHEEHCLFPMNLPLPYLDQPLLGFGGSASMVHPASGYMVGALLRRAPALARQLAYSIAKKPNLSSSALAKSGWKVLWNPELVQRHRLYQFGLRRLMSFDEALLRSFFTTFFKLPTKDWAGFLANTLHLPKLIAIMMRLFLVSPINVKLGMIGIVKSKE